MLKIRNEQMETMSEKAARSFASHLGNHLRQHHTEAVEDISDAILLPRVEEGIRLARSYGIVYQDSSTGREDFVVETQQEAFDLAHKLAGIDPSMATPIKDDQGNVTRYVEYKEGTEKVLAEVHFHESDLAGHPPEDVGNDWSAQKPHVNYANWRQGKKGKGGKHGHVIFKRAGK